MSCQCTAWVAKDGESCYKPHPEAFRTTPATRQPNTPVDVKPRVKKTVRTRPRINVCERARAARHVPPATCHVSVRKRLSASRARGGQCLAVRTQARSE